MSLRIVVASLACALVVAGCGRDGSPGAGANASSSSSTAVATPSSASIAPSSSSTPDAAAARLVHLPVPVARASAELEQIGNEHLAEHAFDGDPTSAWCAVKLGKDAWVEGELASPQRLRRLVVRSGVGDRLGEVGKASTLHGRIDDAIVVLDAGGAGRELPMHFDPAAPLTTIEVPGEALVRTVRVRVVNATKGKKGDDVCLGEVALVGDAPTTAAPASVAAPAHGPALDKALAALSTSSRNAAADLLGALGWSPTARKLALLTKLRSAGRERAQLDADPDQESIVRVTFLQKMDRYLLQHDAVAILDDEAHGDVVLGRRIVRAQLCLGEASGIASASLELGDEPDASPPTLLPDLVSIATHVAHAPSMEDVVVRSMYLDRCGEDALVAGRDAMQILTIDRGALETIASATTVWDVPVSDFELTPTAMLECIDGPTKPCLLGGVSAKFDEGLFSYRDR
jgi:hypothetical protein